MMAPCGLSCELLGVLLDHAHALDEDLLLLGEDLEDLAGGALVVAGDDLDADRPS